MRTKVSKRELERLRAEARQALARLGGNARAKKLTKKRRREIARMGGKAGGRGRPRSKRVSVKRTKAA